MSKRRRSKVSRHRLNAHDRHGDNRHDKGAQWWAKHQRNMTMYRRPKRKPVEDEQVDDDRCSVAA